MDKMDFRSQSKLLSVLNALNQSIVILNSEGHIMHFNHQAINFVSNYTNRALKIGCSIMDFLPTHSEPLFKSEVEQVLSGIPRTFDMNIDLSGNGETEWFEFSFAPIMERGIQIGASLMGWSIEVRKQTEMKIRRQLNFEQLIASISSKFITISDVNEAIDSSLEEMGVFSDSSRAYVFEMNRERTSMSNTFEWCKDGVIPKKDNLKDLSIDLYPWWMTKLKRREIIDIQDSNKLPKEASAEKAILDQLGVKSVLVLPLFIRQELKGFIGFDSMQNREKWSTEEIALLKITSEIFSHAFERLETEEELKDYNAELEATLELLQEAQSQIIQQEKFAGIGYLAAGVAHEMNNPLGYIMSNVEVLNQNIGILEEVYQAYEALKEGVVSNNSIEDSIDKIEALHKEYYINDIIDDLQDLLGDINEGLMRVSKIVNSLRFFSNVDQCDRFSKYDLNEGIENTLMMISSELKQKVEVIADFGNIPLITCVGSQINQVLLNLLLNSTYAIKNNVHNDRGHLYIETRADQENVYCKIQDNGGGMDEEEEKHIFTPFYTTKPVGEGSGLGLSIAYDVVVKKHKGKISVENKYGEGMTFNIILPILQ